MIGRESVAQHFLLSSDADKWREADIHRMSEEEARGMFRALIFADRGGRVDCPHCKCDAVYELRTRPVFKCKGCGRQFSLTTGTPFANRKLSFKKIILFAKRFCAGAKGVSARELHEEIGVTHKTAFVMLHKLRGIIERFNSKLTLSGVVEVDGAEFGGHVRPKNLKKKSTDFRKFPYRHSGKKQHVIVARERNGIAVTTVTKRETDAIPFLLRAISPGTTVHSDSAACWNILEATFPTKRINHKVAYFTEESSTNWAESFFSHLRRMAFGTYHRIAGAYLARYAAEAAWRQNLRKLRQTERFLMLLSNVRDGGEQEFVGYWQRTSRDRPK